MFKKTSLTGRSTIHFKIYYKRKYVSYFVLIFKLVQESLLSNFNDFL